MPRPILVNDGEFDIMDFDPGLKAPEPEVKKSVPKATVSKTVVAEDHHRLEQIAKNFFDKNKVSSEAPTEPMPPVKAKRGRKPKAAAAEAVPEADGKVNHDEKQAEQDKEKINYITTIKRFQTSKVLGKHLKDCGVKFTGLEKKSTRQLEELCNRCIYFSENANSFSVDDMKQVFQYIEAAAIKGSRGRLQLSGWTELLYANEQFLMDLELFRIQYLSFMNVDYRIRLLKTMITTALLVDNMNKKKLQQAPFKAESKAETAETLHEDNIDTTWEG